MTAASPEARNSPEPVAKTLIDALLLLISLSVLTLTLKPQALMDPDIWLHMRTGLWILTHRAVPSTDVFSSSGSGHQWIAYSWLFDVLAYRLFQAWGGRGLLALLAVFGIAYTAGLMAFLLRYMNSVRAMILTFSSFLVMMALRTPRPWLFTILFFTLELILLRIAREENRPALLIPIVPLFALWANLHIQFIYGFGAIGLFALEASLPLPVRRFLRAGPAPLLRRIWLWLLLPAAVTATFLNPYGWNLYRIALEYARQSSPLTYIQEYQAMPFRSAEHWIVLALILVAAFTLGCAKDKEILSIALLAASCFFAFRSQRDIWFPAAAAVFAFVPRTRRPSETARSKAIYVAAVALSLCVGIGFCAFDSRFSGAALHGLEARSFPQKAADYISSHRLPGPIFNPYGWGDYLIWRLPGIPVSIDGRSNFYETTLERAAKTGAGLKGWSSDPDLKRSRLAVVEDESGLASVLRLDPAWRLLYEDQTAAVFQPVTPPAPQ